MINYIFWKWKRWREILWSLCRGSKVCTTNRRNLNLPRAPSAEFIALVGMVVFSNSLIGQINFQHDKVRALSFFLVCVFLWKKGHWAFRFSISKHHKAKFSVPRQFSCKQSALVSGALFGHYPRTDSYSGLEWKQICITINFYGSHIIRRQCYVSKRKRWWVLSWLLK